MLALANLGAALEFAGKRGGKPSASQASISDRLIALARLGHRVLRLKGGDPCVFGRGGEEALALAKAGIPFRIIPGVTSGLAALTVASIPATLRGVNQALILVTGHCGSDEDAGRLGRARADGPAHRALYGPRQSRADRGRPDGRAAWMRTSLSR